MMKIRHDKQQIEMIANDLVQNTKSFPFDFSEILSRLSETITIYKSSFNDENVSWLCKKFWSTYEIYVNRNHSESRQRFTMAHELWHIVLWHMLYSNQKVDYRSRKSWEYSQEEQNQEIEANAFASALLMPKSKVKEAMLSPFATIDSMSKQFAVSEDAMKVRLFNLWYDI